MVEYSHVKVSVKTGSVEVVYDIPKVDGLSVIPYDEETDIRDMNPKTILPPPLQKLIFSMHPNGDKKGVYMTITRTAEGVKVDDANDIKAEGFFDRVHEVEAIIKEVNSD